MVLILVVVAWLYVTLMMAVAEGSAVHGTVLGAIVTFALYGLLPVAIIVYIFSTPARKRVRKAREERAMQEWQAGQSAGQPDGGGEAAAGAERPVIAPVREEP